MLLIFPKFTTDLVFSKKCQNNASSRGPGLAPLIALDQAIFLVGIFLVVDGAEFITF